MLDTLESACRAHPICREVTLQCVESHTSDPSPQGDCLEIHVSKQRRELRLLLGGLNPSENDQSQFL